MSTLISSQTVILPSRYDEESGQVQRRRSRSASPAFQEGTPSRALATWSKSDTKVPPPPEDEVLEFQRILNGFPRTARFLTADGGKSTVIVRRFDELAVRNLLHLEGRVAALESVQRQFDRDDFEVHKDNEVVTRAASSWEQFALFSEIAAHEDVPNGSFTGLPTCVMTEWVRSRKLKVEREKKRYREYNDDFGDRMLAELDELGPFGYRAKDLQLIRQRWDISNALATALKEYQEAVLRYRDMLKLEEPAARTDIAVQKWIQGEIPTRAGKGPERQFLKGSAMDEVFDVERIPPIKWWAKLFGVEPDHKVRPKHKDRVTLGVSGSVDPLTRGVSKWSWLMKRGRMKDFQYREIVFTPEHFINKFVTVIVLAYAALSLVGALWFLYLTTTKQPYIEAVLGLLSFFIILFGISLLLFTNSSRTEVFAATAAYAAVLVVFLGQGSGNGNSAFGGRTNSTAATSVALLDALKLSSLST